MTIKTLQKLEIQIVDIDSVIPNEYNPNRQSDIDFELLCRSIEEDGFTQPILVSRETNQIIDGEHRWRACKVLGINKIPVVYVDMPLEQRMVATLRHNRARGTEDINLAAEIFKKLDVINGLDAAQDSLLIDDIELQVMLTDIKEAVLVLRNPGEELSIEEVEEKIAEEKQARVDLKQEERNMFIRDQQKWTIQLMCEWFEADIIRYALGNNVGNKTSQLVDLVKKYYIQ